MGATKTRCYRALRAFCTAYLYARLGWGSVGRRGGGGSPRDRYYRRCECCISCMVSLPQRRVGVGGQGRSATRTDRHSFFHLLPPFFTLANRSFVVRVVSTADRRSVPHERNRMKVLSSDLSSTKDGEGFKKKFAHNANCCMYVKDDPRSRYMLYGSSPRSESTKKKTCPESKAVRKYPSQHERGLLLSTRLQQYIYSTTTTSTVLTLVAARVQEIERPCPLLVLLHVQRLLRGLLFIFLFEPQKGVAQHILWETK